MRRVIIFFMLIGLIGCANRIDLQAHRGGRGLMPENTLPAFSNAMKLGVTTLELDTDVTRDGVVVIGHDPSLNPDIARGPDGKWLEKKGPAIYSLTFAELQQYDIGRLKPGTDYAKRYPQQVAIDGTRYARLIDLFALVKSGNSNVRFNIETKISPLTPEDSPGPEAFVDALLAVINAAGMAERVALQSFDWRTLKIAQQKAPGIPTVYLSAQQKFFDNIGVDGSDAGVWTAGLRAEGFNGSVARMVKAAGGTIWSPYMGDIDESKVREAHALGLSVVVWTVNEPNDIERMLKVGADGIISDYPDRVLAVLSANGMRVR